MSWTTISVDNAMQINKSKFKITITQPDKTANTYRIQFNNEIRIYLYNIYGIENVENSKLYYKSMIDAERKVIGINFSSKADKNYIPLKCNISKTKGGRTLFAYCTNMINTIIDKCGKIDISKMKSIPIKKDENDDNLLIFSFEPYIIK